jgi:hypothetical protein
MKAGRCDLSYYEAGGRGRVTQRKRDCMVMITSHDNMAASPCRHVFDFVITAFCVVIIDYMVRNFVYGFSCVSPIKSL